MNFATALANARATAEADRRMINAGTAMSVLMGSAGRAPEPRVVRPTWTVRAAILGSGVDMKYAARHHAQKWRDAIAVLSL
jgi:hypothetical protein